MDAPNTSSYVILSPDSVNLPNSRTLLATGGIILEDTGAAGTVTVNTNGNLANLQQFGTAGYVNYNEISGTFQPITLVAGNGINIVNANGQDGASAFSVVDNTTIQRIEVAADDLLLSTRQRVNFVSSGSISVTVVDNPGTGAADIHLTSGIIIAPTDPDEGTLLVGDGTEFIGLPIGPTNSLLVSTGVTATWLVADFPQVRILSNGDAGPVPLENGIRFVPTNTSSAVNFALPDVPLAGEIYRISGFGPLGWRVSQKANQYIQFLDQQTTTGTSGGLVSLGVSLGNSVFNSIEILCVVDGANPIFTVTSVTGNLSIV